MKALKTLKIKMVLTEEMLGMSPANPEIQRDYISSKGPDAISIKEEVEAVGVDAVMDKQMTIFPRNSEGKPIIWDYQMKGWLKDAWGMLRRIPKSECGKIKNYKKNIDGLLFPTPRQIIINIPEGLKMGIIQRPLRASTAQGERIALASSETVPAGSSIEFDIDVFDIAMIPGIVECLDYGVYRGLGQWRNSGKGLFTYTIID